MRQIQIKVDLAKEEYSKHNNKRQKKKNLQKIEETSYHIKVKFMILMKKKQAILIKVKYMKLMIMISQILMKKMKILEIDVFKDIEILKK